MNNKLKLSIGLLLSVNIADANIINGLWKRVSNGSEDLTKRFDGIEKRYITDNMYVYKLTPKTAQTEPSVENTIVDQPLPVEVEKHPDVVPVPPAINLDPHQEAADVTVVDEKQVVYGTDSPLRDDAVTAAWEHAREAERRLQEHREYMRKVRDARKNVSDAKRVSGAINQSVGE
jgi:hypothetical protein